VSKQKRALAEYLLDNMTWSEKILWSRLRHKQLGGYYFQRQEPIRGYILDFWCPAAKIAVELDGPVHDRPENRESDRQRDEFLTRSGIKVLRFLNSDVRKGMSAVLIRIWDACNDRAPITAKSVKPFSLKGKESISRHAETVEMRGLSTFQEDKRLKTHEENFSRRYWEKRRNSVHYRQN
jgi:very-short-patch-repair endonuclease